MERFKELQASQMELIEASVAFAGAKASDTYEMKTCRAALERAALRFDAALENMTQ